MLRPPSQPKEPCPFCGGMKLRVTVLRDIVINTYYVQCMDMSCGADGPAAFDRDTAVLLWDTRNSPHRSGSIP